MLKDDVEEDDSSSSGGFSSRQIISLVRNYWGVEDYVPPIDQPGLKHAIPGQRKEWQEDNYSSLLALFGLYTPNDASGAKSQSDAAIEIPVSLENEPPSNVRHDQKVLAQYLSTKTNPEGVKTRLTLLPFKSDLAEGGFDINDDAGYETELTLPGNTSSSTLRELCKGSGAQSLRRNLAESDPAFHSKSTNERIRTKNWNEDCHWVVSFPGSEDGTGGAVSDLMPAEAAEGGMTFSDPSTENKVSVSEDASKVLRNSTSVHSSWSYFPDLANSTPAASPSGSNRMTSTTTSGMATESTSNESLQVQALQHQIATLERDLKDPSSLRDRDSMHDELRLAKRELKSLKPLWRRFWG